MKKLVMLAALLLITGLCFAQETGQNAQEIEGLDLEIFMGLPVHWSGSTKPHDFNGAQYGIETRRQPSIPR